MYFSNIQKIIFFFYLPPDSVSLLRFPCVKKRKKNTLFSITSLQTMSNWSGKNPGTNKSNNRPLKVVMEC